MIKYYVAGYLAISLLCFLFSGFFGSEKSSHPGDVAAGSLFWPVLIFVVAGINLNVLRLNITDWINKPKKVKKLETVRVSIHPEANRPQNGSVSNYREMDCNHCGHSVAPKQSKA
jgi:hypothetical protein